jgi:iron complex outermembrane receptor protein
MGTSKVGQVRLAVLGALALASAAPAVAAEGTVLEEITVTAEKRVGTVQETPISIAAFSGDELVDAGVHDSYGLADLTPGLTIQKEFIGKVVIRGVGVESTTIGSDPGVAIHRDGAYVARSSVAIFDFFDVNRIEVLRGPQGTLYGRNATGGVINILSN